MKVGTWYMDIYEEKFLMDQIYSTIFSLANKLQVEGDKRYGELTSKQLMILVAIGHLKEDKTTFNNIAKKMGTTKQSIQQVVATLEKGGFVEIVPSKEDKRAVNVIITSYGKQTMVKGYSASIEFYGEVFKSFSTEEMQILWCLLKKLYRFDGKEQDGFEGDMTLEFNEEQMNEGMKAFEKLKELREKP